MRHTGDARVTLVQYITLVLCVTLVMHASHWCSKKRIFWNSILFTFLVVKASPKKRSGKWTDRQKVESRRAVRKFWVGKTWWSTPYIYSHHRVLSEKQTKLNNYMSWQGSPDQQGKTQVGIKIWALAYLIFNRAAFWNRKLPEPQLFKKFWLLKICYILIVYFNLILGVRKSAKRGRPRSPKLIILVFLRKNWSELFLMISLVRRRLSVPPRTSCGLPTGQTQRGRASPKTWKQSWTR